MSKKILIPTFAALLITLFAGLVMSSEASAQGNTPLGRSRRARPLLGQVTAVGQNQFSIQKRDGATLTFRVDENSRYRDQDKAELTFADLKTGAWVAVVPGKIEENKDLARLIIMLPEDFDPSDMAGARGRVTDVNLSEDRFTLENRDGEQVLVSVNEETIFRGEASELEEIQAGMLAGVSGEELAEGELLAKKVRAGNPAGRYVGEIVAVQEEQNAFTLKTRRGSKELVILVNEETRFHSRNEAVSGLAELKPGMVAMVVTEEQAWTGVSSLTATLVAAGEKENLPEFDSRKGGKIVSLGEGVFTIEARNGSNYSFQVTEDTQFRSRAGRVDSFEDLKEGMLVLVGAKEIGSGNYQAQMVAVMPRR